MAHGDDPNHLHLRSLVKEGEAAWSSMSHQIQESRTPAIVKPKKKRIQEEQRDPSSSCSSQQQKALVPTIPTHTASIEFPTLVLQNGFFAVYHPTSCLQVTSRNLALSDHTCLHLHSSTRIRGRNGATITTATLVYNNMYRTVIILGDASAPVIRLAYTGSTGNSVSLTSALPTDADQDVTPPMLRFGGSYRLHSALQISGHVDPIERGRNVVSVTVRRLATVSYQPFFRRPSVQLLVALTNRLKVSAYCRGPTNKFPLAWGVTGTLLDRPTASSKRLQVSLSRNNENTKHQHWIWNLQLQWGSVQFKLPIMILTSATDSTMKNALMAELLPVLYLSIFSRILQDGLRMIRSSTDVRLSEQQLQPATAKSRSEAILQQQFMAKQAASKKQDEKNKNGLVVLRAVYEKQDVTIPLQFWVHNSRLELAAGSKEGLLGFYKEETEYVNSAENDDSDFDTLSGWQRLWASMRGRRRRSEAAEPAKQQPQLSIQYTYRGRSCSIRVSDGEAVSIPRPQDEEKE